MRRAVKNGKRHDADMSLFCRNVVCVCVCACVCSVRASRQFAIWFLAVPVFGDRLLNGSPYAIGPLLSVGPIARPE